MIRCSFCGCEFDANAAQAACSGCPVAPGCHLIRCPRCGYEMPPEPALFKWFRGLKEKTKRQ